MTIGFLEQLREIPDHRMTGTVTYPRDEILLSTLAGVLRGAAEFDPVELLNREYLAWLGQFLLYRAGIPRAQTFRKVFRLLKPEVLEKAPLHRSAKRLAPSRAMAMPEAFMTACRPRLAAMFTSRIQLPHPGKRFFRILNESGYT